MSDRGSASEVLRSRFRYTTVHVETTPNLVVVDDVMTKEVRIITSEQYGQKPAVLVMGGLQQLHVKRTFPQDNAGKGCLSRFLNSSSKQNAPHDSMFPGYTVYHPSFQRGVINPGISIGGDFCFHQSNSGFARKNVRVIIIFAFLPSVDVGFCLRCCSVGPPTLWVRCLPISRRIPYSPTGVKSPLCSFLPFPFSISFSFGGVMLLAGQNDEILPS